MNDLAFEMVPEEGGATLYVVDHDKPADASKMGGTQGLAVNPHGNANASKMKPSFEPIM